MSDIFFEQLELPYPDINLGIGSGTQAEQTAGIMIGYEKVLKNESPDICVVVGDVTSTMACSITSQKMKIKVAHVEAGLRSNDWSMPEEINRIVTDSISNYFFTTTKEAKEYLERTGVNKNSAFFVGNTMIDTLIKFRQKFFKPTVWNYLNLKEKEYLIMTLHRPSNVDNIITLQLILQEIINSSENLQLIFPVHPRTFKMLSNINISCSRLHIIEPLSYLEFNYLVEKSLGVLTDSGGITEETTFMNIPCITLRNNTERPETINIGTNELIGNDASAIRPALNKLLNNQWKRGNIPELWDGNAAKRIVKHLIDLL